MLSCQSREGVFFHKPHRAKHRVEVAPLLQTALTGTAHAKAIQTAEMEQGDEARSLTGRVKDTAWMWGRRGK